MPVDNRAFEIANDADHAPDLSTIKRLLAVLDAVRACRWPPDDPWKAPEQMMEFVARYGQMRGIAAALADCDSDPLLAPEVGSEK